MKQLFYTWLILLSSLAIAQGYNIPDHGSSSTDDEVFTELMTEIKGLYAKKRFSQYKMDKAAKIYPDDLTLNKVQALYWMDHGCHRAIPHLNLVLDSLPKDSTWTEKRLAATYCAYMYNRGNDEVYELFKNDLSTLLDLYDVGRKELMNMNQSIEEKYTSLQNNRQKTDSLNRIKYVDIEN